MTWTQHRAYIKALLSILAGPSGRAVSGVGLRPFACWDCGLESHRGAWKFVCCECCVLSGRGLYDGLITRPEESYRLWRVVVCNQESSLPGCENATTVGCIARKTNMSLNKCMQLIYCKSKWQSIKSLKKLSDNHLPYLLIKGLWLVGFATLQWIPLTLVPPPMCCNTQRKPLLTEAAVIFLTSSVACSYKIRG